ncbi:MAG: L-fuculose phosphate aldolase [Firmicutes bacterium ADurb.Bin182]|nr:MAG: L-fuculose phosphate aldolase [Firmicutes bacterium ADurb.Bin182]
MTNRQAKREMIKYGKIMYRSGMINLFEGNISMRLKDRFLITPSQHSKEDMTEDMTVELDKDGNIIGRIKEYKPSTEYKMHLEAYRLRPDVNAVIHTHSLYATAFAIAGRPISSRANPETNFLFGEIPLCSYGTPGTESIFSDFKKYLPSNNVMLLANHGVISVGSTIQLAYSYCEAAEKIAKLLLIVSLMGGENALPEAELESLRSAGLKLRKEAIEKGIAESLDNS